MKLTENKLKRLIEEVINEQATTVDNLKSYSDIFAKYPLLAAKCEE